MKKNFILIPLCFAWVFMHAQVSPSVNNATGGSATLAGGGYLAWSVGEPIIGASNAPTVTITQGMLQTWPSALKNLMLTLYLEGLFNGTTMNKARNAETEQYSDNIADKITIELHNAISYSTIVYSTSDVPISTTGQVGLNVPGNNYGSYFITVKHRNSIETTTASPISFAGGNINYSFDTSSKAFGDNLKAINGKYCIYAGDVNQDGSVDESDLNSIGIAASDYYAGFLTMDVNGDGIVDALDLVMTDNNAAAFVAAKKP